MEENVMKRKIVERKVNVVEDLDGIDMIQVLHCLYTKRVEKLRDIMYSR